MKLSKIENTCSMFELGEVWISDVCDKSRNSFQHFIKNQFFSLNVQPINYCIIYNSRCKTIIKYLLRLGFKKIGEYKGYEGKNVQILLWKPNTYTWYEKLKILFS